MLGVIGRMFGSDKAIEKGIETVANGLDKLVYTQEEKAEDHAKAVTEARTMLVGWMEASQGQRLARRVIALAITFTWLSMYLAQMGLALADKIDQADIVGKFADSMNGAVMLILAFYFAAPHIGDVIKPAMDKFGKTPK